MVNSPAALRLRAAFAALLLATMSVTANANGTFPFDRELASAEGPLPGCRQAPAMTVSRQDRHVHFRVCCNRVSAPAHVEGGTIRITGPLVSTRMYCGEGQRAEDRLLQQLDSQRQLRWRREGDLIVFETEPPLRFRIPPS